MHCNKTRLSFKDNYTGASPARRAWKRRPIPNRNWRNRGNPPIEILKRKRFIFHGQRGKWYCPRARTVSDDDGGVLAKKWRPPPCKNRVPSGKIFLRALLLKKWQEAKCHRKASSWFYFGRRASLWTQIWQYSQTGLYRSRDNRLIKCVRLFGYSYWLPIKSILKLDNRKYFGCCHAPGLHKKAISNFVKASHILVLLYLTNILAKVH